MAFIIRFRPDIWISVEGRQIAIILKSSVVDERCETILLCYEGRDFKMEQSWNWIEKR